MESSKFILVYEKYKEGSMDQEKIFDRVEIFYVVRGVISKRLEIDTEQIRWNSSLDGLGATVPDRIEIEMTVEEIICRVAVNNKILNARTVGDIVNAFCPKRPSSLRKLRIVRIAEKVLITLFGPDRKLDQMID